MSKQFNKKAKTSRDIMGMIKALTEQLAQLAAPSDNIIYKTVQNARGQGSYGIIGSHDTICNTFNHQGAQRTRIMHTYFNSTQKRQSIECQIARLRETLGGLSHNDNAPAYELALHAA